ncbi:MAG: hypothetical protein ACLFRX_07370 [Gemmatimonadota bacterium]
MKRSDRPFVVGRRTRTGTTVVLVRGAEKPIPRIRGPWELRAVVTPSSAS